MARRKNSTGKKATDFEVQKRVNTVYNMLMLGVSRADILQYAADNWKIEERTTDDYIARAKQSFIKKSKVIQDEEFGKAKERLDTLFQKNMKIQDYKAALATQKEINSLLGMYPAKKHEIAGRDGGTIDQQIKVVIEYQDDNPKTRATSPGTTNDTE